MRWKSILSWISTFTLVASLHAVETAPNSYFSIRSQGANLARHLAGTEGLLNRACCKCPCGFLSLTLSHTRTRDADGIRRCLLGTAPCSSDCRIHISGKKVTGRKSTDWLADYFYLPSDFQSSFTVKPRIDNTIVEVSWHLGLDEWYPGLYLRIDAPLTVTRWDLNYCEDVTQRGTADHPAGYFTPEELPRSSLLKNFKEYAGGGFPDVVRTAITTITPNIDLKTTFTPLRFAKMSCKRLRTTRAADLRAILGFDCSNACGNTYGIKVVLVGPAGNRPKGEFLFEPIAGNGHHWELGAGIRGSIRLGQLNQSDTCVRFHFDGYLSHLFSSRQTRTFDLDNKPFSRYMLAHRLTAAKSVDAPPDTKAVDHFLQGPAPSSTLASHQFQGTFSPVANLTTSEAIVNAAIQSEWVFMLECASECMSVGVGYNLWARSCEKIVRRCETPLDREQNTWALKGDAQMFGFMNAAAPGGIISLAQNAPVALSATQNNATINAGTNDGSVINAGIDLPQLASADGTDAGPTAAGNVQTLLNIPPSVGGGAQINTSIQPKFIKPVDIKRCPPGTSGLSHKIFGYYTYFWQGCHRFDPAVTLGGEAEFSHNELRSKGCSRCAVSQWGIWLKGSIHFPTSEKRSLPSSHEKEKTITPSPFGGWRPIWPWNKEKEQTSEAPRKTKHKSKKRTWRKKK